MSEKFNAVSGGKGSAEKEKILFGQMLLKKGLINKKQLENGLRVQSRTGELLGSILIKSAHLTEEDIARTTADTFDLEYIDLDDADIDRACLQNTHTAPIGRVRKNSRGENQVQEKRQF